MHNKASIFINKNKNILERWLTEEVKAGENIDYYLHIGNKDEEKKSQKYALIILSDWKQININENEKTAFLK